MNEPDANPHGAGNSESKPAGSTPLEGASEFEIIRAIGRGGYGEVYLARDRSGGFKAVKVIFRESFDHDRPFEREYEGLRKFEVVSRSYDNQVQVLHVGRRENPKQFYYIMELADDQQTGREINPATYKPKTLGSELEARGRLPAKECLAITAALVRALENLHENGFIHRDIKPANIIFVNGKPKLADLGLLTNISATVSYVGTEGYIPPEGPSSTLADIFSLGKVLYQISTGRDRLEFPQPPANLAELHDGDLVSELNAIAQKACDQDPRKRYQTANEMLQDIHLLQRGRSVIGNRTSRKKLARVALVAAGAALCVLGFVAYRHFSDGKKIPSAADNRNTTPQPTPKVSPGPGPAPAPVAVAENVPAPEKPPATQPAPQPAWVPAAEPVDLFNGRDLTGWEGDPRIWSVQDGQIVGRASKEVLATEPHTHLFWKEPVGDFELNLSVKFERGNSGILYRCARLPNLKAAGYQFEMYGSNFGGLCDTGDDRTRRDLLRMYKLPEAYRKGGWNEVTIIARGSRLTHKLNGQTLYDHDDFDPSRRMLSGLLGFEWAGSAKHETIIYFKNIKLKRLSPAPDAAVAPPATAAAVTTPTSVAPLPPPGSKATVKTLGLPSLDPTVNTLSIQEKMAGWQLLFDGKTLSGWRNYRAQKPGSEWQAANGMIILLRETAPGQNGKLQTGLMTEAEFGDFDLTLQWRISPGANSGILYRVSEISRAAHDTGMEMQILDNQVHPDAKKIKHQTGACYDLYAPARDVTRPPGEWNTARILVQRNHVEHWLNGFQVVSYELDSSDWKTQVQASKFKKLPNFGRSERGHIVLQDHEFHVEFRNIKIRPLN